MLSLDDKKELILNIIYLQPCQDWFQQCLQMYCTPSEVDQLQEDEKFLSDVNSILFQKKKELIELRDKAIRKAASKGNWQGVDKQLQEIDARLFSIRKDIDATLEDVKVVIEDRTACKK